jgi:hypothetical protein
MNIMFAMLRLRSKVAVNNLKVFGPGNAHLSINMTLHLSIVNFNADVYHEMANPSE